MVLFAPIESRPYMSVYFSFSQSLKKSLAVSKGLPAEEETAVVGALVVLAVVAIVVAGVVALAVVTAAVLGAVVAAVVLAAAVVLMPGTIWPLEVVAAAVVPGAAVGNGSSPQATRIPPMPVAITVRLVACKN